MFDTLINGDMKATYVTNIIANGPQHTLDNMDWKETAFIAFIN